MNRLTKKVPFFFWGLIPVFLFYLVANINEFSNINIHDIYFVMPIYMWISFLLLLFFISGLGYYLSYYSEKFKPLFFLTFLNVILIISSLILLFLVPEFKLTLPAKGALGMMENIRIGKLNDNIRFYGFLSFVIAQIILVLNLTISIFRKN